VNDTGVILLLQEQVLELFFRKPERDSIIAGALSVGYKPHKYISTATLLKRKNILSSPKHLHL